MASIVANKCFWLKIEYLSTDDPLGFDRNPILITTGMAVSLNIYRTFYHQYPWPYSDCGVLEDNSLVIDLPDRTLFDILVEQHANYPYTRKMCLVICTQVMTSSLCGCNTRRIEYQVPNISVCSLADELTCVLDLWNSAVSLKDNCSTKCPFECAHSVFHPEISYADQSISPSEFASIIGNTYWCAYIYKYLDWWYPSCLLYDNQTTYYDYTYDNQTTYYDYTDGNQITYYNYTYFYPVLRKLQSDMTRSLTSSWRKSPS